MSVAIGLHFALESGSLWVLPYTETLARRLYNPGAMGPTTPEEQLRAAELTVWFLGGIGGGLFLQNLFQGLLGGLRSRRR